MPKIPKKMFVAGTLTLCLVVGIWVSFIFNERANEVPVLPTTCLDVKDQCIQLEWADTDQTRLKGLSGRESLDSDSGMLFIFEQPARECIWMKNMRFSIDIIWLDEAKTISKIERNVSPETYPATFCQDETMYVIELNAGEAEKLGLELGQKLNF